MTLISPDEIKRFAEPIGKIALAYANLEWAAAEYIRALEGTDDSFPADGDIERKPISAKLKFLRRNLKHKNLPREVTKILHDLDEYLKQRDSIFHGQFFTGKLVERSDSIIAAKFCKGKEQPDYISWTVEKMLALSEEINNAASALSAFAYHVRGNDQS